MQTLLPDPFSNKDLDRLLSAWVHGWTISRGTAAPIPLVCFGHRVQVGLPGHLERYILQGHIPTTIQRLAQELDTPDTWLKICAPQAAIAGLLPGRWQIKAPEYLMVKALQTGNAAPGHGYTIKLKEDGALATARACNAEGQVAATGRVALSGQHAIFDQIVTEPAHRRRGLGNAIMQTLCNHALDRQANTGVLVATADGFALYKAMGWTLCSEMTAAILVG
ncbi:GNAT family N-acetyltransferase [Undibacterium sp. TS12]|uniref:GNAT family N-acetyltransferase n=1 Tax=Undibacterium sp. TS12 TaxID=2908202 RepID=UPI001F4C6C4D|nr:GNAT family N-acetyltransferase [Undibacterium sp. TS12]MCH8622221.1 GNAT family N-acetyltransferase [Undibacterium sp. TS12]